jgi:hypothetical protein
MCALMINPVLTLLFDLFLIGSASTIIAGMVQEYLTGRTVSVGSTGRGLAVETMPAPVRHRNTGSAARQTLHRVA